LLQRRDSPTPPIYRACEASIDQPRQHTRDTRHRWGIGYSYAPRYLAAGRRQRRVCTDCRKLLAAEGAGRTLPDLPRPQLGEREIEVVVAWLIHETKEAAARELYIELSTVKTTIQRTRLKYEAIGRPASTQVGLLVRLLQDGVIDMTALLDLDLRPHRG
jgi:hypothetical protein